MPESLRQAHIIFVTGLPVVGKTTVICAIVRRFAGEPLAGFYTEELREHGVRNGSRLLGFGGK